MKGQLAVGVKHTMFSYGGFVQDGCQGKRPLCEIRDPCLDRSKTESINGCGNEAGNLLKLVTLHSEDAAGYPTWYRK